MKSFPKFLALLLIGAAVWVISYTAPTENAKEVVPKKVADTVVSRIPDKRTAWLDTLFKNRVARTGFNGCVLIAQKGNVIYEKAFGYADLETKKPLTLRSAFQLASASKPLTAAAILLLYDQGKLGLDDDITKWLPDFPYSGITIKMLLTHRSGLFNYIYACEGFCQKPNSFEGKVFDNEAMLQLIGREKPAVYAQPGKKFEYCNTNYALLPLIVEKVSGQKFQQFMKEQIFEPLGMHDTWVHEAGENEHDNATKGFKAGGKIEDECYADDVVGDKGVYSTVEDLLKWDQALYSEILLKKSTIEAAFTGYSHEHKGKRNYGLGWRIYEDGKIKLVYHNGWWHGYNSLFFRRPADSTTVIMLCNRYNRITYNVRDVLTVLDGKGGSEEMEGEE